MPGLTTASMSCAHRTVLAHEGDVGARDVHLVRRAQVANRLLQAVRGELAAPLEHEVVVAADLLDANAM